MQNPLRRLLQTVSQVLQAFTKLVGFVQLSWAFRMASWGIPKAFAAYYRFLRECIKDYLESQEAQNNKALYPKVAHN